MGAQAWDGRRVLLEGGQRFYSLMRVQRAESKRRPGAAAVALLRWLSGWLSGWLWRWLRLWPTVATRRCAASSLRLSAPQQPRAPADSHVTCAIPHHSQPLSDYESRQRCELLRARRTVIMASPPPEPCASSFGHSARPALFVGSGGPPQSAFHWQLLPRLRIPQASNLGSTNESPLVENKRYTTCSASLRFPPSPLLPYEGVYCSALFPFPWALALVVVWFEAQGCSAETRNAPSPSLALRCPAMPCHVPLQLLCHSQRSGPLALLCTCMRHGCYPI